VVDQVNRTGELRLTPQGRDLASRYGINYTIDVPVKKAGAYQLRVAFRDAASGNVGSAYQFVEAPDLGNERLALSGILMTRAQRARRPCQRTRSWPAMARGPSPPRPAERLLPASRSPTA
jgi:hypothetical protein